MLRYNQYVLIIYWYLFNTQDCHTKSEGRGLRFSKASSEDSPVCAEVRGECVRDIIRKAFFQPLPGLSVRYSWKRQGGLLFFLLLYLPLFITGGITALRGNLLRTHSKSRQLNDGLKLCGKLPERGAGWFFRAALITNSSAWEFIRLHFTII